VIYCRVSTDEYVFGEGDQPPLTSIAIARRLCAMGIKTPGETRGGTPRIRESGMWSFCTVREILISETYAGVWR
jgi:hypothetical protein